MAFPLQSNTREVPFYRFDWPSHSSCGSVMRSKLICSQGLARFSYFSPRCADTPTAGRTRFRHEKRSCISFMRGYSRPELTAARLQGRSPL